MTEYWVSQGNHWCEYCRIWLANNPASIRMHEGGQKHKQAVAAKLKNMHQQTAAQEREKKQAEASMDHIERMAKRQFEKDMAEQRRAEEEHKRRQQQQQLSTSVASPAACSKKEVLRPPSGPPPSQQTSSTRQLPAQHDEGWVFDNASGYFYSEEAGYYYDSESGLYFSDDIGRWVTQEEAHKAASGRGPSQPDAGPGSAHMGARQGAAAPLPQSEGNRHSAKKFENPSGPVRKKPAGATPGSSGKGVLSAVAVEKKRKSGSADGPVSTEEAAALAARQAARKRLEERDKQQLGLYSAFQ